MAPVFGPVAQEGYRTMSRYNDGQVELLLDFLDMSREFLARHTARVHELIAERDVPRLPRRRDD
jgi:hypothetical protein